jgi:hypothetical protein
MHRASGAAQLRHPELQEIFRFDPLHSLWEL